MRINAGRVLVAAFVAVVLATVWWSCIGDQVRAQGCSDPVCMPELVEDRQYLPFIVHRPVALGEGPGEVQP